MAEFDIPPAGGLSQLPTRVAVGVYFLWQASDIVYVGQSRNISERIGQHLQDRTKTFDGLSFIETHARRLDALERHYIETLLPRYNRCGHSKRIRREASWGSLPKSVVMQTDAAGAAEYLGLSVEQFRALEQKPRTYRLPRSNTRRYRTDFLRQFAHEHAALIDRVRQAPQH